MTDNANMDTDYILVEGDLERIKKFVLSIEEKYEVKITKSPSICLTMVKAEDSLEHQPFYLGEVLTTDAEVVINNESGIGICIGDEPVRAYCIAVIDAIIKLKDDFTRKLDDFLKKEEHRIMKKEREEQHLVMKTKVDFKLMEQE